MIKNIKIKNVGGVTSKKIDVNDLSNGLYFVKLKSGEKTYIKTISITK